MRKDILESSRKIKRKRSFFKIILLLFLFLAVLAGIVWLLYIPQIRIKNISVKGQQILNKEKIISKISEILAGKYFYIISKDNIVIFSKEGLKKEIMKVFPRVKEIMVDEKLPDSLLITIKERESKALLCQTDKSEDCYYIDKDGFVFERAPSFSGNIYLKFYDNRNQEEIVSLEENLLSEEQFRNIVSFREMALKEKIFFSKISLKKENIYEIENIDGWKILINDKNDPLKTFENLKTVLGKIQEEEKEKILDYIDLRFGDKIFYKFK
jgi:cell division septal protein FtsQ